MRTMIYSNPRSVAEACSNLEAHCEGYVQQLAAEIGNAPEGAYPCCIKCGGFKVRNGPMTPDQAHSIQEVLEAHGYSASPHDVEALMAECEHEPCPAQFDLDAVLLRDAYAINESGHGNTIELACYQAAAMRAHGDDPHCAVRVFPCYGRDGTRSAGLRAAVVTSSGHQSPEKQNTIDDPVQLMMMREQNCACGGGPGHDHDHGGTP